MLGKHFLGHEFCHPALKGSCRADVPVFIFSEKIAQAHSFILFYLSDSSTRTMIVRQSCIKLLPSLRSTCFRRSLHASIPQPPIPPPTPFVPDVPTFLTLIGRQLSQHSSKIPTWKALFRLTSSQLRELGVEPARSRRYLLWWREKFRKGEYGIGGDLKEVTDGVGEVRILEMDGKKVVANTKPGEDEGSGDKIAKLKGVKIEAPGRIVGSFFDHVKGSLGSVARIKVQEGLWEIKRGRKIYGGERRRKNVLSRIAARERGTLK